MKKSINPSSSSSFQPFLLSLSENGKEEGVSFIRVFVLREEEGGKERNKSAPGWDCFVEISVFAFPQKERKRRKISA